MTKISVNSLSEKAIEKIAMMLIAGGIYMIAYSYMSSVSLQQKQNQIDKSFSNILIAMEENHKVQYEEKTAIALLQEKDKVQDKEILENKNEIKDFRRESNENFDNLQKTLEEIKKDIKNT